MGRTALFMLTAGAALVSVGAVTLHRLQRPTRLPLPAAPTPAPARVPPPPDRWMRLRLASRETIDFNDVDARDMTFWTVIRMLGRGYGVKIRVWTDDFTDPLTSLGLGDVGSIPMYRLWDERPKTLDQQLRELLVQVPVDAAYAVAGDTIHISTPKGLAALGLRPAPRPNPVWFEREREKTRKLLATVVDFEGTEEADWKDQKLGFILYMIAKKYGFRYRFHERLAVEEETGALLSPWSFVLDPFPPMRRVTVGQVIAAALASTNTGDYGEWVAVVALDGEVLITTAELGERAWVPLPVPKP